MNTCMVHGIYHILLLTDKINILFQEHYFARISVHNSNHDNTQYVNLNTFMENHN